MQTESAFVVHNQSILEAILAFGMKEQIPLGIELKNKVDLCGKPDNRTFAAMPAADIVSSLLADSKYKWMEKGGVVEVRPIRRVEVDAQFLNMQFEKFGGIRTTIQGLGVVLSGHITARLHPSEGYALDILSSPEAEEVPPFTLHDVSLEQIANFIVSLGSKGVWIVTPKAPGDSAAQVKIGDLDLHTYGYKDDARMLKDLCVTR